MEEMALPRIIPRMGTAEVTGLTESNIDRGHQTEVANRRGEELDERLEKSEGVGVGFGEENNTHYTGQAARKVVATWHISTQERISVRSQPTSKRV